MKYEFTEPLLAELERYAPSMPDQAKRCIRTRTLEKINGKRRHAHTRIIRRILVAVCVVAVLTTGVAAVNINVDLTGLYEPIFGARGAQFLQGINKTSSSNGIMLTVDRGYSDGESALLFFTLTDTEGKGRITEDLILDFDFSTWYNYYMRDAKHFFGITGRWHKIEISPDHQSGQFYVDMKDEVPIGRQLLVLDINSLSSDHHYEEITLDFDVAAYLADPNGLEGSKLPLPLEGGGWLTGLALTDKGLEMEMEYEEEVWGNVLFWADSVEVHRMFRWDDIFVSNGIRYEHAIASEIQEDSQLEDFQLRTTKNWSNNVTDVNLRTTFRLDTQAKAERYTLNVPAWGGTLETVTVSPGNVVLTGQGFWEYEWMQQATEQELSFRMITESGQSVPYVSEGNSWLMGTFTKRFIGVIPDDLIALEIGGVVYRLEKDH